MPMLLGAIADDLTGATDLANMLARNGLRTVLAPGVRGRLECAGGADAVVVALKSRSIAPEAAVRTSLEALQVLQELEPRQFYFKYCSTFDSTDSGNIGPVAQALLAALGSDLTIFCPSFPENGRTVYQGHLFVHDRLLSESGMENHPLNPMRDPNLVRVLRRQAATEVGLVPFPAVRKGPAEILASIERLRTSGVRLAIIDAVFDEDLVAIGEAVGSMKLVTGGSALALGIAAYLRRAGLLCGARNDTPLPDVAGPAAVISGSCSTMTNAQVAEFRRNHPFFEIDPVRIHSGENQIEGALRWAQEWIGKEIFLISATSTPERVAAAREIVGDRVGTLVEETLANIALGLRDSGVRRLVVAGGETSGAVIEALGIRTLQIGRQIAPGVPWTVAPEVPAIAIALKSGNFGSPDFFETAFRTQP